MWDKAAWGLIMSKVRVLQCPVGFFYLFIFCLNVQISADIKFGPPALEAHQQLFTDLVEHVRTGRCLGMGCYCLSLYPTHAHTHTLTETYLGRGQRCHLHEVLSTECKHGSCEDWRGMSVLWQRAVKQV